ncbi:cysteine dioxygenase [Streptomyces meridianus]|uniref:Cysteine dioxygenase family protein n=1 Tax=Streptomyces meridianus TaxID=2938945 RepID=A0ABT0XAA1_9ACTN|nr:cysteine dioxygenase family protein [Streptomyces meridianus]MCM2579225.1 cysteine dioxygenase family protein [Streptomyces meridianus]
MNSDVQIAGDLLAVPHLLPPVPRHPTTLAEYAGLLRAVAADRTAWSPLVAYDATSRWYHRLRTGPGYELWLLSWVPGQGSGRHGHGRSAGLLTVLDGELTEHSPGPGTPDRPRVLRPGDLRVLPAGHIHEVVNDTLAPAVSLHLYHPGLTEMPMHPRKAQPAAARPDDDRAPAALEGTRG